MSRGVSKRTDSEAALQIYESRLETPVGRLVLLATPNGLAAIRFEGRERESLAHWIGRTFPEVARTSPAQGRNRIYEEAVREYFAGRRRVFDLPLEPRGTVFQKTVWAIVAQIPFGRTATYGEIAHLAGQPRAARAVGAANGANPIPIVIPCHRVVAADGALTGYGGGVEIKGWLLAHEGVLRPGAVQMGLFARPSPI